MTTADRKMRSFSPRMVFAAILMAVVLVAAACLRQATLPSGDKSSLTSPSLSGKSEDTAQRIFLTFDQELQPFVRAIGQEYSVTLDLYSGGSLFHSRLLEAAPNALDILSLGLDHTRPVTWKLRHTADAGNSVPPLLEGTLDVAFVSSHGYALLKSEMSSVIVKETLSGDSDTGPLLDLAIYLCGTLPSDNRETLTIVAENVIVPGSGVLPVRFPEGKYVVLYLSKHGDLFIDSVEGAEDFLRLKRESTSYLESRHFERAFQSVVEPGTTPFEVSRHWKPSSLRDPRFHSFIRSAALPQTSSDRIEFRCKGGESVIVPLLVETRSVFQPLNGPESNPGRVTHLFQTSPWTNRGAALDIESEPLRFTDSGTPILGPPDSPYSAFCGDSSSDETEILISTPYAVFPEEWATVANASAIVGQAKSTELKDTCSLWVQQVSRSPSYPVVVTVSMGAEEREEVTVWQIGVPAALEQATPITWKRFSPSRSETKVTIPVNQMVDGDMAAVVHCVAYLPIGLIHTDGSSGDNEDGEESPGAKKEGVVWRRVDWTMRVNLSKNDNESVAHAEFCVPDNIPMFMRLAAVLLPKSTVEPVMEKSMQNAGASDPALSFVIDVKRQPTLKVIERGEAQTITLTD